MTDRRAVFVRVTGLVQGVGFRPTVYRIARELSLSGEVFNDAAGVGIHLEGAPESVLAFPQALRNQCPPLARIDSLETRSVAVRGDADFVITATHQGGKVTTAITADAATCRACLADCFDPANRRYRYAFTNCTHCGPRFTITRHLPYDRVQTSMSRFPMCPECGAEYADPADRRFHAQPNACPVCGPRLALVTALGEEIPGDPVREAVRMLREGRILAVKGIGGFHLVCDARNAQAVADLRRRKRRGEKPLAVMAANAASARQWAEISADEEKMLLSPAHPIVLVRKRSADVLKAVAPQLMEVGVMLPYTPLHGLLFHSLAGEPAGMEWLDSGVWPDVLVMTSANHSGNPILSDNDEAREKLAGVADAFLVHDRDIVISCDDSVLRMQGSECLWIRRSRGAVPGAVPLALEGPSVLACGPYLKNTACLTRGKEAFLSEHIGDLANAAQCAALEKAALHLEDILEAKPEIFACDLHPDFPSTRLAQERAAREGKPLYRIAHHAAHIGAVMAEHGISTATPGLALDGVGLGPDGGTWGGELLLVGPAGFSRLGHLAEIALPGGDRAAREPWRCAAAVLCALGRADEIEQRFAQQHFAGRMAGLVLSPLTRKTSSLGRWVDAAAALLGLCETQSEESTAAMRLEAAGLGRGTVLSGAWEIREGVLDPLPLFEQLVLHGQEDPAHWAGVFWKTLAAALADWTLRLFPPGLEGPVACSGGCFVNRVLAADVPRLLSEAGVRTALPRRVPAGDGGVALGQAWLALLAHREGASEYSYSSPL